MGLKLKKSINLGSGTKLNLNKKSVGVSFGGKGHRTTVNSKGRITNTVGIPGTGVSHSSSIGKKSSTSSARRSSSSKRDIEPLTGEDLADLGEGLIGIASIAGEGLAEIASIAGKGAEVAFTAAAKGTEKVVEHLPTAESNPRTYRNAGRTLQVLGIILFILGLLLTLVFPFALIIVVLACFMFFYGRKSKKAVDCNSSHTTTPLAEDSSEQ